MRVSGMETGQTFLEIEVITARTEIRSKLRGAERNFICGESGAYICINVPDPHRQWYCIEFI